MRRIYKRIETLPSPHQTIHRQSSLVESTKELKLGYKSQHPQYLGQVESTKELKPCRGISISVNR